MDLPMVGPTGHARHEVELSEESADDLVGVLRRAQVVELFEHLAQRLLHVVHRALRIVLALLVEALLALHELFAVEVGSSGALRLPDRQGVGQVARNAVP